MLNHSHTRFALLALFALIHYSAAEDRPNSAVPPTYRSTVEEVRVTFFATDETNHPLEALTKSDFAIVDNERVIRNFRSFMHSEETSLDVVVLVDLSGSVARSLRVAISDVSQLVAREQAFPDDSIAVLSFGGSFGSTFQPTAGGIRPAILCSSGCRGSDSEAKLQAMKSGGVTPLFDSLIFAADFILHHRRTGVRQVLILFSDGNDTYSLHSAGDALQSAQETGALIYSVDAGDSGKQTSGSYFLWHISDATGGRYYSPRIAPNNNSSSNDDAGSLLKTVLDDLRASYVVTYDLPSREAGFHPLRLLPTHNLNLTFHSRNGYTYEPSGQ